MPRQWQQQQHIARKLSTALHTIDFLHFKSLAVRYTNNLSCALPDSWHSELWSFVNTISFISFLLRLLFQLLPSFGHKGNRFRHLMNKQTRQEYHYYWIIFSFEIQFLFRSRATIETVFHRLTCCCHLKAKDNGNWANVSRIRVGAYTLVTLFQPMLKTEWDVQARV